MTLKIFLLVPWFNCIILLKFFHPRYIDVPLILVQSFICKDKIL